MTARDIEIIIMLSSVCTGIGTVLLGLVGLYGLGQWRSQIKYRERYNLARKMILMAYQCEDAIRTSRSPFMDVSSLEIFLKYLQPVQKLIQRMRATNIECQIIFNEDLSTEIDVFTEEYNSIVSAYIQQYEAQISVEPTFKIERFKKIFGGDDDESRKSATKSIGEKLMKHLE